MNRGFHGEPLVFDDNTFTTGYWQRLDMGFLNRINIDDNGAPRAIVSLHESKADMSWRQGTVIGYLRDVYHGPSEHAQNQLGMLTTILLVQPTAQAVPFHTNSSGRLSMTLSLLPHAH